ncbi:UDP-N-acetylmuramate--L-alanine ligase [Methylobrevis pamukkalensis]|uniref:UDP-N-acetylmuramate--L-alanine ligase n=1 Tax=Methylobrevis pamukkalensis TaxID=1439726 RepID=A0A1E3H701_9HYPH|nr:UDP-N-acetylmuramate--L-alanine ligase [Methylobrevis pamukkalensis]
MCLDHPEVQALVGRIEDRRIITYGDNPQADARFVDLKTEAGASQFAVLIRDRVTGEERRIAALELPMPGKHNVSNATAAIAVAVQLGLSDEAIRKGLAGFSGVKRRFTRTGAWNGIAVFDDYGHHPVEIRAVLQAARVAANEGRVIAIVQPHRYSRLASLFDDFCVAFNDADTVIVADVYAAGEAPIEGVSRDTLVGGARAAGHRNVIALESPDRLAPMISAMAKPGDFVVFLGAGNITQWAYALPGQLETLAGGQG